MAGKAVSTPLAKLEREDIQRLVFTGYSSLGHARYLLLTIENTDSARRWLSQQVDRIRPKRGRAPSAVHVAFTWPGLRAMGLPAGACNRLSREFQEGMAIDFRSRLLGDHQENAPDRWAWGAARRVPHALLMLFAGGATEVDKLEADVLNDTAGPLTVMERLDTDTAMFASRREHFGFRDGISQPAIRERPSRSPKGSEENDVSAGEFVLGYVNEYGQVHASSMVTDRAGKSAFTRNGSYLVFRQLDQDVPGFWQFVASRVGAGDDSPQATLALAAKMVGRTVEGCPLADPSAGDGAKTFSYANDKEGRGCPLGAHIRRTNPRDALSGGGMESIRISNRHRLLRRGRPYGNALFKNEDEIRAYLTRIIEGGDPGEAGHDRGLHFICLNSDIARQFEFVQSTWMNNPKFASLYDDPDPIAAGSARQGKRSVFSMPDRPVRHRIVGVPSFVTVKGGAYFFLPGIRALQYLSET